MPKPSRQPLFRRAVLWPIVIAGLIFVASSRSRVASVDVPDSDKIAHFAVYGLLATLVCRIGRGRTAAVFALIVTSAFGASDEWHQSFVPGRTAQTGDWIADTLGAAMAVVLYTRWHWYRSWLETPLLRDRRVARPSNAPERAGIP